MDEYFIVALKKRVNMTPSVFSAVIIVLAVLWACPAKATMRCGSALISVGDLAEDIRHKCGAANKESSEGPALKNNGVPKVNSAKISVWVYGPRNGAYHYLRFIDEKLITIHMRRN